MYSPEEAAKIAIESANAFRNDDSIKPADMVQWAAFLALKHSIQLHRKALVFMITAQKVQQTLVRLHASPKKEDLDSAMQMIDLLMDDMFRFASPAILIPEGSERDEAWETLAEEFTQYMNHYPSFQASETLRENVSDLNGVLEVIERIKKETRP